MSATSRQLARYHYARAGGCSPREAVHVSCCIDRFRAWVQGRGIDPDSLGDMARHHGFGGKPRRHDAKASARRRRYREARALGADSRQASEASTCDMAFSRVKRELRGSPFKT